MARQIFRATNRQSHRSRWSSKRSSGFPGRQSPRGYSGRFAAPPASVSCETRTLVRSEWRLCNHKRRRRLWSVGFGVKLFTPEANVQDGRVCERIRDDPIERLGFPVHPGTNPHGECPSTVQRQPHFHLAERQVYVGTHCSPFNLDVLPRVENLPNRWRNQGGRICSSRAYSTNELWSDA